MTKNEYKSSFYNIYKCNDEKKEIFNSFTKANVFFDDTIFNCIKENRIKDIDNEMVSKLLKLGIVVPSNVNELEIIKKNYIKYRNTKDTLLITLIPTFMCNFRCPYCFEGGEAKLNQKIIDYNILKKYAHLNFNKYKHIHITLFGGEPLLCYDKTLDFFKYLKQTFEKSGQTYSSSIATNAYLLNEERIVNLIEICNCKTFQITIDGCKRTHDMLRCLPNGRETYAKVLDNFKTLLKYNDSQKLNVVLRVNLLNNTLSEVDEFLNEFSDEEKDRFLIYFRYIYNTKEFKKENKNKIDLKEFYEMAKEKNYTINYNKSFSFYHCEGDGAEEQLHILPDLKVYKCVNDMSYEKSYIANINSKGEIIFNNNLYDWNDYSFFEDDNCFMCKYLPMCWGGCPLIFKKTGKRVCIHEKYMEEIQKNKYIIMKGGYKDYEKEKSY